MIGFSPTTQVNLIGNALTMNCQVLTGLMDRWVMIRDRGWRQYIRVRPWVCAGHGGNRGCNGMRERP